MSVNALVTPIITVSCQEEEWQEKQSLSPLPLTRRTGKTGKGEETIQTSGKVSVTMRDSSGKAFIVQVDPADIYAPLTNTESAGITSDAIPDNDSFATLIEMITYEGWLVFEEEPQTTIDWNTHSKPSDMAVLSEISPIQQTNHTPISFKDLPFYVDTGATIHISPEKSDFITL